MPREFPWKDYKRKPLVVATAYDTAFAALLARGGVDLLLVGDSLANVMLGLKTTREVGMSEMLLFTGAVLRGAGEVPVLGDMPFGSDADAETALKSARAFMELGVCAVKLEGDKPDIIRALVADGIPVVGHLGVLPQTARSFRKVGGTPEEADTLRRQAQSLQDAGVCAAVLENVDAAVASEITRSAAYPTIGIGAGGGTNGQVQVLHDFLGLGSRRPPFARTFAELGEAVVAATQAYSDQVRRGWETMSPPEPSSAMPEHGKGSFYN